MCLILGSPLVTINTNNKRRKPIWLALFPFSPFGWPNEDADDFKAFFPNTILVRTI